MPFNIEQQVKDAIEEFGKEAHERFQFCCHLVDKNEWSTGCFDNGSLLKMANDKFNFLIRLKPLSALLAHDVKFYSADAYFMWEWRRENGFIGSISDSLINAIKKGHDVERKKSAAMPFDLERAKAGDAVEMIKNGEWLTGKFEISKISDNGFFTFHGANFGTGGNLKNAQLRMKFPKAAK